MKQNACQWQAWRKATNNIGAWLKNARQELVTVNDQPGLDVQVLMAAVLEKPRAWIVAHPEVGLDATQLDKLNKELFRLRNGEPLPYILGHWEFYGLDFQVSPAVLIPRPETELLVEEASNWIKNRHQPIHGVDVGTGSGCIAISLAYTFSNLNFLAIDNSWPALEVAKKNISRYQLNKRIQLIQANLLFSARKKFDLICANLPYIPSRKLRSLDVARHEPLEALDGGSDGLRWIEQLVTLSVDKLAQDGLLLIEIEASQSEQVTQLACNFFPSSFIKVIPDLSGKPRLLRIENNGN